ncbi:2-oxo acid dehydrogenase subunit E2 [Trichloromonas sp.]|uniref:2-oxo acid dehydrogenase subunit E2 n=1 Tax=Trichloromonas sp. TaxID=3069249 RepID=UPI003D81A202
MPPVESPRRQKIPEIIRPNRIACAFWSLNQEMTPAHKVNFVREIDATAMDRLRQETHNGEGLKPSYTALIVKAATIALKEYPYANRAILGPPFFRRIVQFNNMDITVAIERNVPQAESVVLADTILDTDRKSLVQITRELQHSLTADAEQHPRWKLFFTLLSKMPVFLSRWVIRAPRYLPNEWVKHRGNACFVNSPAKYGIDFVIADMIWPLTVMFGWVKERPIAIDGKVEVRKTMPLSIIFDRRIMAGAPAARFFNRLAEILENADCELR